MTLVLTAILVSPHRPCLPCHVPICIRLRLHSLSLLRPTSAPVPRTTMTLGSGGRVCLTADAGSESGGPTAPPRTAKESLACANCRSRSRVTVPVGRKC